MFHTKVTPRFSETDALGHINNCAYAVWFEEGRTDIFRMFNPEFSLPTWNLILRKLDIEFLSEGHLGSDVHLETWVHSVGNTSFTLKQQATQNNAVIATSTEVLVHYDYRKKSKVPIPSHFRAELEKHHS